MFVTYIFNVSDDDFYALFISPNISSDSGVKFSMDSPLLPNGTACVSFYYSLPGSIATLQVRTRTQDNVTVELWNMTARGVRNWTRVDKAVYHDAPFLVKRILKIIFNN